MGEVPPFLWSDTGTFAAPKTYTVPGSGEVMPYTAHATFDGSGAGATFRPCLTFYSQEGVVLGRYFPSDTIAAGATAEVTYTPPFGTAAVSGGGGGIQFNVDNQGGYLDVTTNNNDGAGHGMHLADTAGGVKIESAANVELASGNNLVGSASQTFALTSARGDIGSGTPLSIPGVFVQLRGGAGAANNFSVIGTATATDLFKVHDDSAGSTATEVRTDELGFYSVAPIPQESAPSSAQDIADSLAAYGLLAGAGTVPSGDISSDVTNNIGSLEIVTSSEDGNGYAFEVHDTGSTQGIRLLSDSHKVFLGSGGSASLDLDGGLYVQLATSQPFQVLDHNGNPILQVDENGTGYHIKSGQAWVADL